MDARSFGSRFAHCDVDAWGRTHGAAIGNCIRLQAEDLTPAQRKRVDDRVASLRERALVDEGGANERENDAAAMAPPSKKARLSLDDALPATEAVAASPPPTTSAGGFSLALSPRSSIAIAPKALSVSSCAFARLREYMRVVVPASPNPRNPKTFLKRKQCTFVLPGTSSYHFGQEHKTFRMAARFWPAPVRAALQYVREHAADGADGYNGVHVNLYEDASVGVAPHADKERSMLPGRTIYSFTLLEDPSTPRPFSIYDARGEKLLDIPLEHESVLEMRGDMQKEFKHGIETMRPRHAFKARVNMTVRAFRAASPRPSSPGTASRDDDDRRIRVHACAV